jgi:hypothetical protein
LTKEARSDFEDQYSTPNVFGLKGDIEAAMATWTLGERVYADWNGKPRFLKRLKPPPPEIWTIRVTDPAIQVRLFGRFIEPDVFVVTRFVLRRDLTRKGKRCPRKWKRAMESCEASWNRLFPENVPLSAKSIDKYVTGNCDAFAI